MSESKQVKIKSVVAIFLVILTQELCELDNNNTMMKHFFTAQCLSWETKLKMVSVLN